ncbi:MAG: beta-ketoacyl-ACP synthase III [Bacillota bacterium]
MFKSRAVGIAGTGSCLPEKIATNADLEKIVETSDEWIITRTGIKERRWTDASTATSDLCTVAAQRALEDAGVHPEEVDMIIVGTVTPDMMFPSTASLVQDRIGAIRAGAFDLSAGCSGFMYSLTVGSQLIASGAHNTVLVIGADTLTKIVNWTDRGTCVLFGDGAGAVVLRPVEEGYGILGYELGSDGSGGMLLKQPAGGSRMPASEETVAANLHTIHMNGNEVFKFAVRVMGDASLRLLKKCGLNKEDVDVFIPHQANLRIIEAALKRLGLPSGKVIINVDRYGNMSNACMSVALDETAREGRLKRGDLVLMTAFGAGLTWATAAFRWSK